LPSVRQRNPSSLQVGIEDKQKKGGLYYEAEIFWNSGFVGDDGFFLNATGCDRGF
jgi:hypothetical protein